MRFYLASLACAWAIGLALPAQAQRAHSRDPFHDVASLNARLAALQAAHPTTTRVVTVATTAHGDVQALEVDPAGKPFDANRDFPVPGQPDHPSQPLIAALRDYVKTGKVVAVLDYHSAAECMLWPFAYDKAAAPPDVDAIAAITAQMASAVGFCSGQVAKVISYKHQGTASDWYQDALGVPAILIELGSVDDPGSQAVEQILIDRRTLLQPLGGRSGGLADQHVLQA